MKRIEQTEFSERSAQIESASFLERPERTGQPEFSKQTKPSEESERSEF